MPRPLDTSPLEESGSPTRDLVRQALEEAWQAGSHNENHSESDIDPEEDPAAVLECITDDFFRRLEKMVGEYP